MSSERETVMRYLTRTRAYREGENALILRALDAGLSQQEIAEKLGRNREWVRQHTPPDRRARRERHDEAPSD